MDNYFQPCPARMSDGRIWSDYRTSHRRELYNMQINGFNRSDDFRLFYQKNAEKILDDSWCGMKQKSCHTYPCFHTNPTVPSHGQQYDEMDAYNNVRLGKTNIVPQCDVPKDYRVTVTPNFDNSCARDQKCVKQYVSRNIE